jgi:hypothetical protein
MSKGGFRMSFKNSNKEEFVMDSWFGSILILLNTMLISGQYIGVFLIQSIITAPILIIIVVIAVKLMLDFASKQKIGRQGFFVLAFVFSILSGILLVSAIFTANALAVITAIIPLISVYTFLKYSGYYKVFK